MNIITEHRHSKTQKRKQIEEDIRQIVIADRIEILSDNIRRRKRREFKKGDRVTIVEWFPKSRTPRDSDLLYRVTKGVVVQVTSSGYFVEGTSSRGLPAKDFVNRAHLINGTVRMNYLDL